MGEMRLPSPPVDESATSLCMLAGYAEETEDLKTWLDWKGLRTWDSRSIGTSTC